MWGWCGEMRACLDVDYKEVEEREDGGTQRDTERWYQVPNEAGCTQESRKRTWPYKKREKPLGF